MTDNTDLLHYSYSGDLINDAKVIIETAQKTFFRLQQEMNQHSIGEDL